MSLLTPIIVSSPGYQVGYGNQQLGVTKPFDLYVNPTSGSSISPVSDQLVINASGTISALTVLLPVNAAEGQRLRISSNQAVTTLTLTAGSTTTNQNGIADTVVGGVSSLTANTPVEYAYRLAASVSSSTPTTNLYTWYRVQ